MKSICQVTKLLQRTERETSPGMKLLMCWEEEVLANLKSKGGLENFSSMRLVLFLLQINYVTFADKERDCK